MRYFQNIAVLTTLRRRSGSIKLLLTDILSGALCPVVSIYENDKSEVPPPQNSLNISEKERKIILP